MIFCIQGKQRNGKTLLMSNIAKDYLDKGFHIIANVPLLFDYIKFNEEMFYDDKQIEALKKKYKTNKFLIILMDAHLLLSAHMARKDARKLYFVTQVMKILEEEGHFLYDTQRYFQMNKTLRENTDAIIHVTKLSGKGDPYVGEFRVLIDNITDFVEINRVILTEDHLTIGLFERFGRATLSENY